MSTSAQPRVTLKLATSLDGKIALSNGQSKWITGPESRAEVHRMRAAHDAILTGVGTILADDPEFTARTDPMPEKQPDLIVLDSKLRTPVTSRILQPFGRSVRVYHCEAAPPSKDPAFYERKARLQDAGAVVIDGGFYDSRPDLEWVLEHLANSYGQLMVEAGQGVTGRFVEWDLADRLVWFRAPKILGKRAIDALDVWPGLESLDLAPIFHRISVAERGDDLQETYERIR